MKKQKNIYQAIAQKTPRPSIDTLQKARKESEQWDAYFASTPDKPKTPAFLTEDTTEEIDGLTILWERDGPYKDPITGAQTREELYHAWIARRNDKGKYEVIAKLGNISPWAIENKRQGWKEFWYHVHSALCLAGVEPNVYNAAVTLVALRIEYPENFKMLILEEQERAVKNANRKIDEYMSRVRKWMDKEKRLNKVQTLSQNYFDLTK